MFAKRISTMALTGLVVLSGCQTNEKPVEFSVTVPAANTLGFDAELTRAYGLGLSGNFDILQYGSVYLRPETPQNFFQFGFRLHTDAFLQESWVNYQEVNTLPTGAAFPLWMTGPVVDVVIPPINTPAVNWHFYLGTRGQYYLGVAAVIPAINQNFPAVDLGYTFYDSQGRVVLGLLFFGPKINPQNGLLVSPGGIFIGSNLTPFLPAELHPGGGAAGGDQAGVLTMAGGDPWELAARINRGGPLEVNGKSVVADVQVLGRDRGRYQSQSKIRGLVDRFAAASRRR
ncbi:MAG: hypothetical protein IT285_02960 [Bdellovibrionales bacterium]|nr:hypothetical protein [Bdellovibrionales bacterium]